jgi:hypothetical protein
MTKPITLIIRVEPTRDILSKSQPRSWDWNSSIKNKENFKALLKKKPFELFKSVTWIVKLEASYLKKPWNPIFNQSNIKR